MTVKKRIMAKLVPILSGFLQSTNEKNEKNDVRFAKQKLQRV